MTVTSEEWETELESVEQVAAHPDTIPAPPPTEPHHDAPVLPYCLCCGLPVCLLCSRSCGKHHDGCAAVPS